jgi:hypothetical protein
MDPVPFAMIGIVSLAFRPRDAALRAMPLDRLLRRRHRHPRRDLDTNIMLLPMLGVLALLIVSPQIALFLPASCHRSSCADRAGE